MENSKKLIRLQYGIYDFLMSNLINGWTKQSLAIRVLSKKKAYGLCVFNRNLLLRIFDIC